MKVHNRTSRPAVVNAFYADDSVAAVSAWSVTIPPGSAAVWKPATKDSRRYKAVVSITYGVFDTRTQRIGDLRDGGQWVVIEEGGGQGFRLRAGLDRPAVPATPVRAVAPGPTWMESLGQQLKGWDLRRLPLLGSHDSGSFSPLMAPFVRAQDVDFEAQLNAGVRFLDLRVTWSGERVLPGLSKNTFYLCHNGVTAPGLELEPQLRHVQEFASQHPREIVILSFWRLLDGVLPIVEIPGGDLVGDFGRALGIRPKHDPDDAKAFVEAKTQKEREEAAIRWAMPSPKLTDSMGEDQKAALVGLVEGMFGRLLVARDASLLVSAIQDSASNVVVLMSGGGGGRFRSTSNDVVSLYRDVGAAGYAKDALNVRAAVDATVVYLEDALAGDTTSLSLDRFTLLSGNVWAPDIREAARLLHPRLEERVSRAWSRDGKRRPFLNLLMADFVNHSSLLGAVQQAIVGQRPLGPLG